MSARPPRTDSDNPEPDAQLSFDLSPVILPAAGKESSQRRPPLTSADVRTVEEVAELIGVSTKTICRWHDAGVIPGEKIGSKRRFLREDIEALLGRRDPD